MMTEDEAKTKWCPHLRGVSGTVSLSTPEQNRYEGNQPAINVVNDFATGHMAFLGKCHGSGCMMFRWVDDTRSHGYCGLAGRPE